MIEFAVSEIKSYKVIAVLNVLHLITNVVHKSGDRRAFSGCVLISHSTIAIRADNVLKVRNEF